MFRRDLIPNKVVALIFMLLGWLSVFIEGDATFFVFSLMLGVPLFFAKQNWIYGGSTNEPKPENERVRMSRPNGLRGDYERQARARRKVS